MGRFRPYRFVIVLSALAFTLGGCAEDGTGAQDERERAIAGAMKVYREKKTAGVDFTDGPCISQEAIPGWAVDVAHDPRQPVDDIPANQCASFREGRTRHFVELDPDGNLIRAR